MLRRARALLLLLPLLAGCAGTAGSRDVGGWFTARGADFMDVLGLRVGVGIGLGAYVRATEWVQLGLMWRGPSETSLVGASGSIRTEGFRVRGVPCAMFGTIGRYGGLWSEYSHEVMLPAYTNRRDIVPPIKREAFAGVVPIDGLADDWEASFGLGVHAVVVGLEAEVRPLQLIDFLAGLLGYDPWGDDVPGLAPGDAGRSRTASS